MKKLPQLPGAGRTRAGHHHGGHTPNSPEAVLLGKMAYHTKQIRRQCIYKLNAILEIATTNLLALRKAGVLACRFDTP